MSLHDCISTCNGLVYCTAHAQTRRASTSHHYNTLPCSVLPQTWFAASGSTSQALVTHISYILSPFRPPNAAVLQLPVGGGGCDSQPWRQPGAGDCDCLPSSRAASACSGAGTLLVPWLILFRRLLDLVPLWQFTAFGSFCVYQLQRLHPLETPCCLCLTDCFHFVGLIDWRAFAICALCCCLEVAIDLHHATTLLGVNTPSSSIHIIVLNLRLGLSRLKLVALRVLL